MRFSLWNAYGSYNIALRYRAGKVIQTQPTHEITDPTRLPSMMKMMNSKKWKTNDTVQIT